MHKDNYSNIMDIVEKLRNVNLRPTKQRILLANQILDGTNKHFTAETIQKEVLSKGQSISLATIYNCLNKFVSVGLLKQIDQQGEVTIFDTNVSCHHHFLNQETGELIDIEPDEIGFSKLPKIPNGFENDGIEVLIKLESKNLV
tara:strand:- start:476 stop:907 length:432 start_codon:yes stop_codon:yes gene_type:complete